MLDSHRASARPHGTGNVDAPASIDVRCSQRYRVPVRTEEAARRGTSSRLLVGLADGISVWVEPKARPGLHFAIDDEASSFVIAGTWDVKGRGMVLVELTVKSRRRLPPRDLHELARPRQIPPAHLSGSALRRLSVPEMEHRAREALKLQGEREADLESAMQRTRALGYDIPSLYQVPRAARALLRTLRAGPLRPGRQGYPIGLYEWIAREYLALVRRGDSRSILPELARRATDRLGRKVTPGNVRDWVHRARELKFLTPGLPGKAHADPGSALRDVAGN